MADDLSNNDGKNKSEEEKKQKPYYKPQLEELGDLRGLTLSGSPGVLDSDGHSGLPGEF